MQTCSECEANHWGHSSGKGCDACNCDPTGVINGTNGKPVLQCQEFSGECECMPGRGGKRCDQCELYYWGNPKTGQCKSCDCNSGGSADYQVSQQK